MLFKIAKAISYPILPLVPECCYCAAMRWSLISCCWTGFLLGGWRGCGIGFLAGCGMVFGLWLEYKIVHGDEE